MLVTAVLPSPAETMSPTMHQSNADSLFNLLHFNAPRVEMSQCDFSTGTEGFNSDSFTWEDIPVVYQYNNNLPTPAIIQKEYSACGDDSCEPTNESFSSGSSMPSSERPQDDHERTALSNDERTECSNPRKKKHGRKVSFSSLLEIRSHDITLGDHPCCKTLAITLGWDHLETEVLDLDLYENFREYRRRSSGQLRLSYYSRKYLLESSTGYTEQDLLLQEQQWFLKQFHAPTQSCSSSLKPSRPSVKTLSELCA